jgi:hypothetical protein
MSDYDVRHSKMFSRFRTYDAHPRAGPLPGADIDFDQIDKMVQYFC